MKKEMKLNIPQSIYNEIMFYVDESPVEISGLGTCSFDKETNEFTVHEIVLLDQENTAATTDIDEKDIAKAMFALKDSPHELRFWWHSHVNMQVFWSGTDQATMLELAEHGWFMSTVFNKRRELRSCLTFKSEFGMSQFDEINTVIVDEYTERMRDTWAKNMREKCKAPSRRGVYASSDYQDTMFEDNIYNGLTAWEEKRMNYLEDKIEQKKTLSKKELEDYNNISSKMWGNVK